jgi:DNA polymerase I
MKIINRLPSTMSDNKFVAMDVETFNQTNGKLHRPNGTFACVSICIEGEDDVYQIYDTEKLDELFNRLEKGTWVFHNSLYDLRQLKRYTKIEHRFIWDTMLVSQTMYGGYYRNHGLQHLVRRDLGIVMAKDVRDEFSERTSMTNEMKTYAALDALYTVQLAVKQKEKFDEDPAFKVYTNIDEPMIWPFLDMPGVLVDVPMWRTLVDGFTLKSRELEEKLGINTMSPAQVKLFLSSEHGINVKSTGKEVLEGFPDNDAVKDILTARMYRKAVSTYGEKWLKAHVEEDGRVYSSYNITGTKSGRNSSSSPNMQQIPARKLPQYRDLFIAAPENVMLIWDVSQQEPCITAYESQDPELLRAISNKEDLHLAVAKAIFDSPKLTKKDKEKRNIGKTINLGTAYGLSEFGLDRKLNCGLDVAKEFLHKYFVRFKGVFNWIAYTRQQAARQGYVSTAAGRKIYINLHAKGWQNLAINSPIQGGAADFTKVWVRNIWEMCRDRKLAYTLNLIVHDEIGMEVPKRQQEKYEKLISDAFNLTAETLFPGVLFRADGGSGRTWSAKV